MYAGGWKYRCITVYTVYTFSTYCVEDALKVNDNFHRLAGILDSGTLAATCHEAPGHPPGVHSSIKAFLAYCRSLLTRLAGRYAGHAS